MRLQLIRRRLRLSWVAALLLLQRAPVVPWVKQTFALLSPFVQKALAWRVALPAVSSAATWHALTGATTYVKSDEANPATGTAGDSFSFGFYTSGYKAFSYKLEGLPSGLSYNGNVNGPLITGTPSSAGTYEIKITGYRYEEFGGENTPVYSLSLNVGSSQSASSPWNDTNTESLDAGWSRSSWFGDFYGKEQGWVYHLTHGWLYLQGTDESGFWVHDETLGWLYTGKDVYPFFYRDSTSTWLYDQSSSSGRKFWDYATSQAITPQKK